MQRLGPALKQSSLRVLRACGALRALRNSEWRRARLAILCYHGFSLDDEHEWNGEYAIPAQRFEQRLELLREEKYHVLPLAEAIQRLYAQTLPPRSVAITVDDGNFDFYRLGAPLLEKYGYPATVYVSTFHVLSQTPPFRIFTNYLLWKARRANSALEFEGLDGKPLVIQVHSPEARNQSAALLHDYVRRCRLNQPERMALLRDVAKRFQIDLAAICEKRILHLIRCEEGQDLVRRGFSLELHTHRHRSAPEREMFVEEIETNREILRKMGAQPAHFCYPSGDYQTRQLPWLRQQGIQSATTCENNLASAGSHPLLLPRIIDTLAISEENFAARLAGVIRSQEQTRFRQ